MTNAHDKRPGQRFTSRILPPYMRRSPRLEEALPVLYLRGLSTGDFAQALPVLAVGDGARGFWAALRQVYPETREQRCWVHKLANVLDKLPKRLQPRAKLMLHEIMRAPDRRSAQNGRDTPGMLCCCRSKEIIRFSSIISL